MNRYRRSPPHPHAGFTLVEVLVSIVVLSFGLLGMVGLQAASLQANRDARLQSVASLLARDLAEMIRGNKDVANLTTGNPYQGSFSSPMAAANPNYCLSVGKPACATPAESAQAEITEWLARADAELPGARVVVCADSAPFDANGLPQWACTAPASTSSNLMAIKIGWTRSTTNKATKTTDTNLDLATIPTIVLPVTAGSTT